MEAQIILQYVTHEILLLLKNFRQTYHVNSAKCQTLQPTEPRVYYILDMLVGTLSCLFPKIKDILNSCSV